MRPTKIDYYLNIATEIATRATCLRRNYGAIIVKDDRIVSTGYNGSPRGCNNCSEVGKCKRNEMGIPQGQNYDKCLSVHAEQNAMLAASKEEMQGAILYLAGIEVETGEIIGLPIPCLLCKKMLINAGVDKVIARTNKNGKLGHKVMRICSFLTDVNDLNQ
jgi:dCMP deaminase